MNKFLQSSYMGILLILAAVIGINIIAPKVSLRFDLTEDRLYTLSQGTKKVVSEITNPLRFKYYFSQDAENIPLLYKNYGKKVKDILEQFVELNPELLSLETYNPLPDSDAEEWASRYGLVAADSGQNENFYMGLAIVREDKEFMLPFFDFRREQYLEYDIVRLVLEAGRENKKNLAMLTPIDVLGKTAQGKPAQKWAFAEELERFYQINSLPWDTTVEIPLEAEYLLLIHPYDISENIEYAIDQFLMRGGNLIALFDPFMRSDPRNQSMAQSGNRNFSSSSNLPNLFNKWGIKYSDHSILGDKERSTRIQDNVSYVLWSQITQKNFNQEVIALQELESVVFPEPGGFTYTPHESFTYTSLIQSSERSGFLPANLPMMSGPEDISKLLKEDGTKREIALIINGEFSSAFVEMPKSEQKEKPSQPYLAKAVKKSNVLLISDADFIADPFSVQRFNLLGQQITQPINDNLSFLYNMIDFLAGSQDMATIRARGKFSRPLEVFHIMQREAQEKYYSAELRLQAKLESIKKELRQLKPKEGDSRINLQTEQKEKIESFREQERMTKKELREIRKLLRQDIETLESYLIALNMLVVPALITFFGIIVYVRRNARRK